MEYLYVFNNVQNIFVIKGYIGIGNMFMRKNNSS